MIPEIDAKLRSMKRKNRKETAGYNALAMVIRDTQKATNKAEYLAAVTTCQAQAYVSMHIQGAYAVGLLVGYARIREVIRHTELTNPNKTSPFGILQRLNRIKNCESDEYERCIHQVQKLVRYELSDADTILAVAQKANEYEPRSEQYRAYKEAECVVREGFGQGTG